MLTSWIVFGLLLLLLDTSRHIKFNLDWIGFKLAKIECEYERESERKRKKERKELKQDCFGTRLVGANSGIIEQTKLTIKKNLEIWFKNR